MERRKDLLGFTPKLGDLIAFNPPTYKGLVIGECVGFVQSGLPALAILPGFKIHGAQNMDSTYTPKTGFVIVKWPQNVVNENENER